MSSERILQRLRLFLLAMAAFLFIGTIVELALISHWEDPTQILPFVLCALGAGAVGAMLFRPAPRTIRVLRWIMGIAFAGSLFGVFEHIEHNIGFALEIQPNATVSQVFFDALGGANPLLAPGMLALAAMLAMAATYYHPSIVKE
ncbi:MAG: hypothetical protein H6641_15055 [Caldilineaceae bacterium]|nr:hypothetical protein [Caldilineaceae bacterium]